MSGGRYGGNINSDGRYEGDEQPNKMHEPKSIFDPVAPQREGGPVFRYMEHLDDEIDRLDNAISNLIDKVRPVLNPQTADEEGEPTAEKHQSDLAHLLEAKCARVHTLTNILHDITRRVEL